MSLFKWFDLSDNSTTTTSNSVSNSVSNNISDQSIRQKCGGNIDGSNQMNFTATNTTLNIDGSSQNNKAVQTCIQDGKATATQEASAQSKADAQATSELPKSGSGGMIIAVIILVVLLGGAGAAGYYAYKRKQAGLPILPTASASAKLI
jgi:hypothetical protein